MHPFEQYLIEQGFRRTDENGNETMKERYSTMSNMFYVYSKDGLKILWGLNESKLPPTLIEPRPKISGYFDPAEWGVTVPDGMAFFIYPMPDVIMHRVLSEHSPADVLKSITDGITLCKK